MTTVVHVDPSTTQAIRWRCGMICGVVLRGASLVALVFGLAAIAFVSVSAARSSGRQGHLDVVARTDHHALQTKKINCAARATDGRLCERALRLVRSEVRIRHERCLEIWGGAASGRITGVVRGAAFTLRLDRSNSCEIHRWDALASLLPRP